MAPTKPYRARSKRLTKTRTEKNGIFANLSHLYHTKICFMLFLKWSKFLLVVTGWSLISGSRKLEFVKMLKLAVWSSEIK